VAITSVRTAAWRGLLAGLSFWLLVTLIGGGHLAWVTFVGRYGHPTTGPPDPPSELDGLVYLPLLLFPIWCLAWAVVWFMHVPWHFLAATGWFWVGLAWIPVHNAWFSWLPRDQWLLWATSGLTGVAVTASVTVVITYALRTVLIRIPRQPSAPDW